MLHVERRTGTGIAGIISILALACSNTPIDAILPLDAGSAGLGNGGAPPVDCSEPVTTVVPGRYNVILDQSGQCLALGDETQIVGTPATGYEVILVSDCTDPGAVFRVQTIFMQPGFELRNVESNLSLDIEKSAREPSTRAVLFGPTGLDNQRFFLSPFSDSRTLFSMAPTHTIGLCLTATSDLKVQIWGCQEGSLQGWRFVPVDCE